MRRIIHSNKTGKIKSKGNICKFAYEKNYICDGKGYLCDVYINLNDFF